MAIADILPTVQEQDAHEDAQAHGMVTPATQDDFLAGVPLLQGYRVLRPCVLYERLGRGGMGSVYRAYHLNLDIDVAVKCLVSAGQTSDHVDRFQREAAYAAKVNAANLVRVFDVRHAHGLHYIIMELVDGESVADRVMRKAKLDPPEACTIAWEAAKGLAAAHAKKVIHRDMKPANVLVSRDGEVKLADLGIASGERAGDTITTHVNVVMGTPQYMPPEQFRGAARCTTRSDVYSLGATLWMMLVGRDPFTGMSYEDIEDELGRVGLEDPRAYRSDIPAPVADLVCRAISRDPQARPENGEAFADELKALLDTMGGPVNLRDMRAGAATGSRFASPTRELLKRIKTDAEQQIPNTLTAGAVPPPVPPAAAEGATAWDSTRKRSGSSFGAKIAIIAAAVLIVGGGAVIVAQRLAGTTTPGVDTALVAAQWDERRALLDKAIAQQDAMAIIEAWKSIDEIKGLAPQDRLDARRDAAEAYLGAMRTRLDGLLADEKFPQATELVDMLRREQPRLLDETQLRLLADRADTGRREHFAEEMRNARDNLDIDRMLELEQVFKGGPNTPRDNRLLGDWETIRDEMLTELAKRIEDARRSGDHAQWTALELQRSTLAPDRFTEAPLRDIQDHQFAQLLDQGKLEEAERLLRQSAAEGADTSKWSEELARKHRDQLEKDLAEMLRRNQWEQAREAVRNRGESAGFADIPAKLREVDESFFQNAIARIDVLADSKEWEAAFEALADAADSGVDPQVCRDRTRELVRRYESALPDNPVNRTQPRNWTAELRRDVKRIADAIESPEAGWLYATAQLWYVDWEFLHVAPGELESIRTYLSRATGVRPDAYFFYADSYLRLGRGLQEPKESDLTRAVHLYRAGADAGQGDCAARLGTLYYNDFPGKPDDLRRNPLIEYDRAVRLKSHRGMFYRAIYQFQRLDDGALDETRDADKIREAVDNMVDAAAGFPPARSTLMRYNAIAPELVTDADLRRANVIR